MGVATFRGITMSRWQRILVVSVVIALGVELSLALEIDITWSIAIISSMLTAAVGATTATVVYVGVHTPFRRALSIGLLSGYFFAIRDLRKTMTITSKTFSTGDLQNSLMLGVIVTVVFTAFLLILSLTTGGGAGRNAS